MPSSTISVHNFLCAYSLQAIGLRISVVSLYIPTVTSLLTQLRTITPFISPALTLSFVASLSSLCIKPHLLFNWTLLYSAPAPSRCTWLERTPLDHADRSHFKFMCTNLNVTLLATVILFFILQLSKMTISFLLFPQTFKPPAQLMTASHCIEAIRENFPHLPPCCYLLPLSVPLYWALFPINEGELCLFLTKPDLPRVGLISPLLIHAKMHDRK